jgi:hypothetical protein
MLRTQISLTAEDRRLLDAEAARTGRSISALIRAAVEASYGAERSSAADLTLMRQGFGAWQGRGIDGAAWVDQRRSGARLQQGDA